MGGLMGGLGGSLDRLVGRTTKLNEITYVKLELIVCLERKGLF